MDTNIVFCENCLDTMARMANDFVDLTLTSPPYDNLRDYNGYNFDVTKIISELFRITKPGGVVVWVVGDQTSNGSESGTSFRQALAFMDAGFLLYDTMIYQKNGPSYPSRRKYYQVFEYMFVFSKGLPKTFNPIQDRENRWHGQKWGKTRTRRNKAGELVESKWYAEEGKKFGTRFNIWKYNVGHGYSSTDTFAKKHPAIFPEQLAADHIVSWSNPGDIVYDCFSGSGTTGKMAHLLQRNWILSEISQEYADLAGKRISSQQQIGIQQQLKF